MPNPVFSKFFSIRLFCLSFATANSDSWSEKITGFSSSVLGKETQCSFGTMKFLQSMRSFRFTLLNTFCLCDRCDWR